MLNQMPDQVARTCVTSPPYFGLRDYGTGDAQVGLEETPEQYVERLIGIFRAVRRVLRDDGTLWLNLGDSYSSHKGASQGVDPKNGARRFGMRPNDRPLPGLKHKDLIGIPWMVAFALRADGWYLRSDVIWHKPNPMPESVTDRPTKAHEYLFLFAKSERYYYDGAAIAERSKHAGQPVSLGAKSLSRGQATGAGIPASGNGRSDSVTVTDTRNKRSVWTMPTKPYHGAHFAVFPPALVEPCILAGAPEGGVVLDPFMGSGTTAHTARRLCRRSIGIELNEDYLRLARERLSQLSLTGDTQGGWTP